MRALSSPRDAKRRFAVSRYAFAVSAVAMCAVVRWSLNPILEGQGLYLAFMIPVAASAYLGGYGPAVTSIALSAVLAGPLFAHSATEPRTQFAHLTLFCLESAAVVVLIRRLQIANALTRAALTRAERANAAKEEFVARISHEWRSPLNVLLGWIGQLEQRATDQQFVARAACHMRRAVDTQSRLISDVLDYSRGMHGKLSLSQERVALSEPIGRAIEAVRAELRRKQLHLCVVGSGEDILIDADVVRLQQVFVNLLSNAVKFTPPEGRIELGVARSADQVLVSIRDTGVGIHREALESIFSPFSQSDLRRDTGTGGLGLGLAIVRDIVELHHGTVTAASPGPGQGSTFTVGLPAASAVAEAVSAPVA